MKRKNKDKFLKAVIIFIAIIFTLSLVTAIL